MKILHFSDTHAGAPLSDWKGIFDKRLGGYINYRFCRKYQNDQSVLSKFVEYAIRENPDIAICTGDITSTGQPEEFAKAMALLDPLLRNSQIRFIYVPGNHESYVGKPECRRALEDAFFRLNGGKFTLDSLPLKMEIKDVGFILANESRLTSIFSSCGYIDTESSRKIVQICEERKEKQPLVLVGHFPIIERHPLLRIRKRLWGQKDVLRLLSEKKILLALCGHVHEPYKLVDAKGHGEVCAGSLTKYGTAEEITYDPETSEFHFRQIKVS